MLKQKKLFSKYINKFEFVSLFIIKEISQPIMHYWRGWAPPCMDFLYYRTIELEAHLFFSFRSHFQVREGNAMWKLYTLTNGRTKNVSHLCVVVCTIVLCVLAEKRALASIHLREIDSGSQRLSIVKIEFCSHFICNRIKSVAKFYEMYKLIQF